MNRQKRSSNNQHPPAMTMVTRSRGRARLTAAADNTPPVRTLAGGSQASQALTNGGQQREEEAGIRRAKRVKYDIGSSNSGKQVSSAVVSAELFSEPGVVAAATTAGAAPNDDGAMSTDSKHRARTITVPRRGMRLNRLLSRVTSEVSAASSSDVDLLPPPSSAAESELSTSSSFFDDPLLQMDEALNLASSDSDTSSAYATATSHDEFTDLQPIYSNGAYESDGNSSDFSDDFYDLINSDKEITLSTTSAAAAEKDSGSSKLEYSKTPTSEPSSLENSLESAEFDVFDSMMAHTVSDIPLVTEPEDEPHVKFRWLEDSQPCKEATARWPIEDDDSSTFSILVKKPASQPRPINAWPPSNTTASASFAHNASQNAAGSCDEPSMDEFFSEVATASFSDEEDENLPSPGQSESGKTATEWIEKYSRIPISGYRLRNITTQDPAGMAPAPATAAAPIKAYYRQAMLAASGLNRQALWSGKARQMVGGFTSYA